jgi:hypothetical protein
LPNRPGSEQGSAWAAICPPAPLLARELTGLDSVIPELRQACAAVVERLVSSEPEVIAIVGPGPRTASWPADTRLDLSRFAPALGGGRGGASGAGSGGASGAGEGPRLPRALGLGARLLDEAGYRGPRLLRSVREDEPAGDCLRLGSELSGYGDRTGVGGVAGGGLGGGGVGGGGVGGRVGLLVMADGSACRSLRAPGYLHPAAAGFDAVLEQAVRGGDLGSLRELDQGLARELLATARSSWQVLAGAMPGRDLVTDILYADAPFGVFYLVASLAGTPET